jgi:hypothetical protein
MGAHHPVKTAWFKHIAETGFTLDGGPAPQFGHEAILGVDFEFIPNWMNPYDPNSFSAYFRHVVNVLLICI